MNTPVVRPAPLKLLFWILTAALLAEAATEFYDVALGTGAWFGGFSPKWAIAFLAFVLLCVLVWLALGFVFWKPASYDALSDTLLVWRGRLGVSSLACRGDHPPHTDLVLRVLSVGSCL